MVLVGVPLALIASISALRSAPDRGFAIAAMVLSGLQTAAFLGLVGLIAFSLA